MLELDKIEFFLDADCYYLDHNIESSTPDVEQTQANSISITKKINCFELNH